MRMSEEEFKSFGTIVTTRISILDLTDRTPRTLMLGCDKKRNTFHVYLGDDGCIHRALYSHGAVLLDHSYGEEMDLNDLNPDSHAYPERTDYDFALLMKKHGVVVQFAAYERGIVADQYYGYRAKELKEFHALTSDMNALETSSIRDESDLDACYVLLLYFYHCVLMRIPLKAEINDVVFTANDLPLIFSSLENFSTRSEKMELLRQQLLKVAKDISANQPVEQLLSQPIGPIEDYRTTVIGTAVRGVKMTHIPTGFEATSFEGLSINDKKTNCIMKINNHLNSIAYAPVPLPNRKSKLDMESTRLTA